MSTTGTPELIDETDITLDKSGLSSEFSRRVYTLIGRPIPGKPTFLFAVLSLVCAFVIAEITLSLVYQWDNFEVRSKAIENLNLGYLTIFMVAELTFHPENLEVFMNTINGPLFKYKFKLSQEQKEAKAVVIAKDKEIKNRFNALLIYYYTVVHLLPCVISVFKILLTDVTDCCENAHYDMVSSTVLTNIFAYILVLIMQNIFTAGLSLLYVCWMLLVVCSLLHIGAEIDVLCIFIKELDNRLQNMNNNVMTDHSIKNDKQEERNDLETITSREERMLKIYLKEIIEHHLAIVKAVRIVNESASSSMFMYNQFCGIELCINLYLGFAMTNSKRYLYMMSLCIVMTLVGIIGNLGQTLTDKGEELHKAINECSWINKPKWFQKSLCFMTMYSSKPLQVKPVGLYVLNLANTTKIGQAAYSYFNLLRSFKDKG